MSQPAINTKSARMAPITEYQRAEGLDRKLDQVAAEQALKDSEVAIARARSLCTIVVDELTQSDRALGEGEKALALNGAIIVDSAFVCTRNGSTGVIVNGLVTDIRNASIEDKAEYSALIKRQE